MRTLILSCLFIVCSFGQSSAPKAPEPPPPSAAALKATRNSFMLVSTHAVALFQSADMIEAGLRSDGSSLHPSTITLRLRIERTLDKAEAAINRGDLEDADDEIKVAGELVTRFSRRIGGE